VHSSRLGIDEFGEVGLFSVLFDDLLGSVSVYAENQLLALFDHRPATLYIFSQQLQGFIVNGQNPLPPVLLLFSLSLLRSCSRTWGKMYGFCPVYIRTQCRPALDEP
jgi:hypothetical protein